MRLVLLISGILLSRTLVAQEWFPLGASWYYNQIILFNGESYRYFEVTGETVIQGKNCKIITGSCSCGVSGYGGYVYEEDDKVFTFDSDAGTFKLLYDFNLVVGDTLKLETYASSGEDALFLIDSITFIQLDTLQLRVQHLTQLSLFVGLGNKIIERIGSDVCMYPQSTVCDPSTGGLRCYEDAELGLINFQSPERPCDYITSAVPEMEEKEIKIFPNPSTGILHIESDKSIEKIELFNSVFNPCYTLNNPDLSNAEINLESLPLGVYILRISTHNKSVFFKRIILH